MTLPSTEGRRYDSSQDHLFRLLVYDGYPARLPKWSSWRHQTGYVEPFTTKSGSEKLRADLVAELRKLRSLTLVPDASNADATLSGGGEIWIKGYQSLNPRSGQSPAAGTAVYGGFLSVELKDGAGETLWSDLVTPGSSNPDIFQDFSKRIAKHVAQTLNQGVQPSHSPALPQPTTILKGGGSTFSNPVYQKWITNYRHDNPNVRITYESVGSGAGVRRLLAGEVDFGASDNPEAIREIAPGDVGNYSFFPSVVGAVVPIVNLPGLSGDVAFTPEALAGIYLGKIKKWNDPVLRKANPHLRLPDLDIVVVHRGRERHSLRVDRLPIQHEPGVEARRGPRPRAQLAGWPRGGGQ